MSGEDDHSGSIDRPESEVRSSEDIDREVRTDGGGPISEQPTVVSSPSEDRTPEPTGPANSVKKTPPIQDANQESSVTDDIQPRDSLPKERVREFLSGHHDNLQPIEPNVAVELYLDDKAREFAKSTVNVHRSRLGFFVKWCRKQGIENMNDVSAKDLHAFRIWRRQDLKVTTEKSQLDTLRVFIEWCESIDAVHSGLYRKIRSPNIDGGAARDEYLPGDRAERILDHLVKFQYATTPHVCWVILTSTGMRLGALRALDIGDYKPNGDPAHLDVRHRPGTDTPLKKGRDGERPVVITDDVCSVIDDYLQFHRPDVTDEHDREPLLATPHGRVGKSTVRRYIYKWSRPCEIGRVCPHDRDPTECEAAVDLDHAASCPSSVTPHPIRRGYISQLLQSGATPDLVSGRCDVSPDIIDKHYDVRSKEDKMRQRQHVLKEIQNDDSPYL